MKAFHCANLIGLRTVSRFAVRCAAFALLVLLGACGDSEPDDCDDGFTRVGDTCVPTGDSGDLTRGRLVTSSATLAEAYVVDLDTSTVSTVAVSAAGGIVQGSAGTSPYAWIVHYPTGPVELLDVGSQITPHGDHSHVTKRDPRLHPFSMTGPEPTHVVTHDGLVAVYFDGLGEARLVSETQLPTGEEVDVDVVTTNMPHHGVAVASHGHLLISVGETVDPPDPAWGASIPVGVAVYDLTDTSATVHESGVCSKLHGETAQDSYVAYGCEEGVLLASYDGTEFSSEVLPYPDGSSGRAFTLKSDAASPVIVGDFGPAFVSIDPLARTVTSHSLPAGQKAYEFAGDGEHLLVLAVDGNLYRVSLGDFSVDGAPLPLVTEFGDSDGANVLVAANRLYAVDSRDASVVVVDIEAWEVLASIELPSAPSSFLGSIASVSPEW